MGLNNRWYRIPPDLATSWVELVQQAGIDAELEESRVEGATAFEEWWLRLGDEKVYVSVAGPPPGRAAPNQTHRMMVSPHPTGHWPFRREQPEELLTTLDNILTSNGGHRLVVENAR